MTEPATHRMYYVALVCPEETDRKVLQFKYWMKDRFGCRVALKSPAHITMIPPFWMEEEKENDLIQTLESFSSESEKLEVILDGFSHFTNRVLFIKVDPNPTLDELRKLTEAHFIQSFGDAIRPDERPFQPHVTVANRDMSPYAFEKAWYHFEKKKFKENFQSNTISLLKLSPGKWNVIAEKNWN